MSSSGLELAREKNIYELGKVEMKTGPELLAGSCGQGTGRLKGTNGSIRVSRDTMVMVL